MMTSKNKLLIPGVLAAMVLVVGVFAFMPVQQANTVHFQIVDAILGEPPVTNQDIAEELKDKIKLMVATDEEELEVGDFVESVGFVDGFNIFVEALDENKENVIFNLKEVYICGTAPANDTILVDKVYIENIQFNAENVAINADVIIANLFGNSMGLTLVLSGSACVDVISVLANDGRAGAMGLGSDEELAIVITGSNGDFVDFVKCIAFTPNKADTLRCEIVPFEED